MKKRAYDVGRAVRLAASLVAVSALLAGVSTTLSSTTGCSSPDTAARVDPIGPDRAQFDVVAPMLVRRCGSIDCHGSTYRNMRVYGFGGVRLRDGGTTSALRPDFPAFLTYDEIEATYQAVIGVEPEIMRDVVKAGGVGAGDLTLVRKAHGDEKHIGQARIKHGDDADLCLLSWLASSVDVERCNAAGCVADGGLIEGEGCGQ